MTSTAMGQRVDIEKLRAALRHMSRGNLLNKLAIRLVLYRVRAHFAHTHFLRFLFLAPADLLFILQASVVHPR